MALVRLLTGAMGLALVGSAAMATSHQSSDAYAESPTNQTIWQGNPTPKNPADSDTSSVELGTVFASSENGTVSGIQFYKSAQNTGTHTGKLWNSDGKQIASVTFNGETASGWQTASLSSPVAVAKGQKYTVSYNAPNGQYADDTGVLSPGKTITSGSLTAYSGVYTYGAGMPNQTWMDSSYYVDVVFKAGEAATPPATTTPVDPVVTDPAPGTDPPPPATTSFPGPSNTGVPAGVALTPYSGPCTITTPNTVIDAKAISCDLVIAAPNVQISRSTTKHIDSDSDSASVSITDSEVDGGTSETPAVGYSNITMKRVNVHGARVSVLCGSNCSISDSWLHSQYMAPGSDWHVNGYVSNGGSNVLVQHNTIACDVQDNSNGGGCTGPAASFGDFAPLSNITYDNNLFVASPGGYCLAAGLNPSKPYGSNPTGIVVTNNVFQRGNNGKCGAFGAATSFPAGGSGNVWSNNSWDDGKILNP
ncbi:DUF4082 domain-containing protein [Antricoccus suffuscus]|nr:DUF4082 domain-containing protein [Antricoccus suffuscus]